MRRRVLSGMMATALLAIGALPALAQAQPEQLGTFTKWTAWKANDGYGTICFISAAPDSTSPTKTADGSPINRDPPSFLVLHREKAPAVNADGTAFRELRAVNGAREILAPAVHERGGSDARGEQRVCRERLGQTERQSRVGA